jgi:hypothetical protein
MDLAFGFTIDRLGSICLTVAFVASHMQEIRGCLIPPTVKQDQIVTNLNSHDTTSVLCFRLWQTDQAAQNRQIGDKVSSCHRLQHRNLAILVITWPQAFSRRYYTLADLKEDSETQIW